MERKPKLLITETNPKSIMKKNLLLAAVCLAASLTQAAPILPEQLQLLVKVQPFQDLGTNATTMYNPRVFDGNVFASQINWSCFGRYPWGSPTFSAGALEPARGARMLSPFRGAFSSTYMLGSGGTLASFTRYNWDGTNPQDAPFPDGQLTEGFDWVDNDTIISTDYTSGNRKRLYLVDVAVNPFALTKNTTWNANGFITSAITTRIRNVRVGEGAGFSNYAYYGDNGVSVNPKVYALNLTTGVETELGSWNGTLKAGIAGGAETDSWGLWTVVERGGYLYLQSSDDGIQVYSMTDPTTMGPLYTYYSPEAMQAATGDTKKVLYGFDVAPNGEGLLLAAISGTVYELQKRTPLVSGQWQLRTALRPADYNPPQQGNSTYNPRYFDGNIYTTQLSGDTYRCFGFYDGTSLSYLGGAIPPVNEHRMLARMRSPGGATYEVGSGGAIGANMATFATTLTRYESDYYASSPVAANTIDDQVVESFDWVDDDTIITTCYMSGQRKKLYLIDVTADPFTLTKNTNWNANGYVENTAVTTRIRNVRVGQVYSGYAYYGDAGQNTSPAFYAINLTNGVSTLLGNAGTLTGGGSFGLWTVVERGGYLYVQTTDNGIQVYNMINATNLGSLYTTYAKAELDASTGIKTADQYYGIDMSADAKKMVLGAPFANVFELEPAFRLSISQSGTNVSLSWPTYYTTAVIETSATLEPINFSDLSPQPAVKVVGDQNVAIIPADPAAPAYFRLRK